MDLEEINSNLKKVETKIGTLCISRDISTFYSATFVLTGGISTYEVFQNANLYTTAITAASILGLGVSVSFFLHKQRQINKLLVKRNEIKQKKLSLKNKIY